MMFRSYYHCQSLQGSFRRRRDNVDDVCFIQHAQTIRELEHDLELPVLKTFQPLERKPVAKVVVDKPVEPEIQSPRRPAVPPPQPPVAKPSPVSHLFVY